MVAELDLVVPDAVVCLGATAGRAVLGRPVRIGAERGAVLDDVEPATVITTHPSALLRLRGKGGYDEAFAELVADLKVAAGQ